MKALCVTLRIKPEHHAEFMKAILENARGSLTNEPGCLRYDVLQDDSAPDRICLYEVYRDEAAIDAHRQAPHYLLWRETVQDWMAADPVIYRCTNVFPSDADWR